MADTEASVCCMPFLASRNLMNMSVEEPGAVTPTFLPLRSAIVLILPSFFGATSNASPEDLPMSTKALTFWFLACIWMVCS
ncbi:hypothetical protein D9M72_534850 [compost metagenome]